MSRTDKDRPFWTKQPLVPFHSYYCVFYISRSYQKVIKRSCDLPKDRPRRWNRTAKDYQHCYWGPDWSKWTHKTYSQPPKWFLDHRWNNPQRRMVRDKAKVIIGEYNTGGEVFTEIESRQHRHCGVWYWN